MLFCLKKLFCLYLRVFPCPAVPAESHHTEECLAEDAARHLTDALATVHKDDAHLLDLETDLIGRVFHLYLETIALETDLVEFDGLQHTTLVTLESCCSVVDQLTTFTPLTYRLPIARS